MAISPAIAGESSASAPCSNESGRRPRPMKPPEAAAKRVTAIDWPAAAVSLDERGYAIVPALLGAAECSDLAGHYVDDDAFRSRVVMQRHAYGRGEYKYFR